MAIQKTRAVVLRRREFRNTSLIVSFCTEQFGKLQGLVKGIRAPRPRFASQLDLGGLNEIIYYERRLSNLQLVTQAVLLDDVVGNPPNLATWPVATYFLELVDSVAAPHEHNPAVFQLLLAGLSAVSDAELPEDVARVFEVKLLAASGFMPRLRDCLHCQAPLTREARLSVRLGGLLCAQCLDQDRQALAVAPGTVATIAHLERTDWPDAVRLRLTVHARLELQRILSDFLAFHLDRQFPSLRVLRSLLRDVARHRAPLTVSVSSVALQGAGV